MLLALKIYNFLTRRLLSDKYYLKKMFKETFGRDIDFNNPKTLNEKIMWLMLYERKPFHTIVADKYRVRAYLKEQFGEEYLVPLDFVTDCYKDIVPENLPNHPFIIKSNHSSGDFMIIRDKNQVKDWRPIQMHFRKALHNNYYWQCKEWQYKNIPRKIIVEKLLETPGGHIPNDYKLNCINGKVEFIYVSIDREGSNKRNIYSRSWEPLYFTWAHKGKDIDHMRGEEILPPESLTTMIDMAERIAKDFKYVRVDFYDVDGVLYFGEITLHHGNGTDIFTPEEYDYKYGGMLDLSDLG